MSIIKNDKSNVLAECKCDLCGHEWESIKEYPKCCPSCKRYDWIQDKTTSSSEVTPEITSPQPQQPTE